jgi:Holliday junction resolvasome RuvABC DNA-binding subunit
MLDYITGSPTDFDRDRGEFILVVGFCRIRFRTPKNQLDWIEELGEGVFVSLKFKGDEFNLYGFAHMQTRDAFDRLCRVPGVGPGMAMKVLDRIGAHTIHRCRSADFASVPGIGERTAAALEKAAKKWSP